MAWWHGLAALVSLLQLCTAHDLSDQTARNLELGVPLSAQTISIDDEIVRCAHLHAAELWPDLASQTLPAAASSGPTCCRTSLQPNQTFTPSYCRYRLHGLLPSRSYEVRLSSPATVCVRMCACVRARERAPPAVGDEAAAQCALLLSAEPGVDSTVAGWQLGHPSTARARGAR